MLDPPPRSTVGTVTEIYDYLRLLYAKTGTQYCTNCNIPVQQQTLEQIVDSMLALPLGTRLQLLSPVVRGRKGHYREMFDQFRRQGFTRVRVDGELQEILDGMQLARYKVHTIELVIDRLVVDPASIKRFTESVDTAVHLGEGGLSVLIEQEDGSWMDKYYSTSYSCPSCGTSYDTPAPNMFSFNSPFGACETCGGIGQLNDFDVDLIIPDYTKSITQGGIGPLGKLRDTWLWKQVTSYATKQSIDLKTPINEMSRKELDILLYGNNDSVTVTYASSTVKHKFIGILPSLRHQYEQSTSASVRKGTERYFSNIPCRSCNGARLKPAHLFVRVGGKNIHEATSTDIVAAREWFSALPALLTDRQNIIATLILKEIVSRLFFLEEVGLNLSNTRSYCKNTIGWRITAHSFGKSNRLAACWRNLRVR